MEGACIKQLYQKNSPLRNTTKRELDCRNKGLFLTSERMKSVLYLCRVFNYLTYPLERCIEGKCDRVVKGSRYVVTAVFILAHIEWSSFRGVLLNHVALIVGF